VLVPFREERLSGAVHEERAAVIERPLLHIVAVARREKERLPVFDIVR
jgi:hypothetical protein